jgi:hypothetical protein
MRRHHSQELALRRYKSPGFVPKERSFLAIEATMLFTFNDLVTSFVVFAPRHFLVSSDAHAAIPIGA